ncbi:glutathione S-transferase family protein [Phreatobacter cathodiphilus]|nr:glutathione S-transferase family protein [Phreatobacter cathodiphilus]
MTFQSPDRMRLHYAETLMPRKACFVARHLDAPVDFVRVDLGKGEHKAPAFRALNPNGKVPLLVDGDLALWESDAIMMHLALGMGSDLWPADRRGQVEVQRWLSWAAHEFNPQAGTLYFEHVIRPMFGIGEVDGQAEAAALARTRKGLQILDAELAERNFILGPTLSLADVSVAVTFPYADKANIPLGDYPAVARWNDRLRALAHWDAPFPQLAV